MIQAGAAKVERAKRVEALRKMVAYGEHVHGKNPPRS